MSLSFALDAYNRLADEFVRNNPKSAAVYKDAQQHLPGGNTRSVLYYDPFPLSISQAHGSRLVDVDGHEYTDFLGEYTAGLYGHSEPVIVDAISQAARGGLNFGGQHADEGRLAQLVKGRFPSMDLLRFTNSGTEATLMALAAAKAYTKKNKIVVFVGAYHGGAFTFADGKTNAMNAPPEYIICKYNSISSVREQLKRHVGNVAAILVEPMMGSGGAIPAQHDFLVDLRKAATEAGAVLIFDEVMTSRMHRGGGVQSQLPPESRPDLTTLGKYLGGGMSFGAFGGRREIMALFDPRREGGLAHAGTFNNNVLTMAAGRAGLSQVFTPERAEQLHANGERLRRRLQDAGRGTLLKVTGYGSIMCFHFTKSDSAHITSKADLADEDKTLGALLHLYLLQKGIYIARRGFFAMSLALNERDMDALVNAVKAFVSDYASLITLRAQRESRL